MIETTRFVQTPIGPELVSPAHRRISQNSSSYDQLYTLISISICAYFGVFLRVVLCFLSEKAHFSILPHLGPPFFLPNIVGTLLLGVFGGKLADNLKGRISKHLQIGICTGFCGCCTTFASWHLYTSVHFLRGKWLDSIILSLVTFSTSFLALIIGRHLSEHLSGKLDATRNANSKIARVPSTKNFLSLISTLLAITLAIWVGVATDSATNRRKIWVAMAFGPLGALLRYVLSLYNPRFPNFPLFTLLANLLGTLGNILILIYANYENSREEFRFWIIEGVSVGAMGSLSTVSTWINEIYKLSGKKTCYAYRYALISDILGHFIAISIGAVWVVSGNKLHDM